jgi:hypothetical protein
MHGENQFKGVFPSLLDATDSMGIPLNLFLKGT